MKYDAEVNAAAAHWAAVYGVPIDTALVHAIIERESSHGKTLVYREPRGGLSFGPMMVRDSTARDLGARDPGVLAREPSVGISYGVQYLAQQLRRFPGDVQAAISAYNAGPGNAKRGRSGLFPNNAYVVKVLGFWNLFKRQLRAAAPAAVSALAILAAVALGVLYWSRRRPTRGW